MQNTNQNTEGHISYLSAEESERDMSFEKENSDGDSYDIYDKNQSSDSEDEKQNMSPIDDQLYASLARS